MSLLDAISVLTENEKHTYRNDFIVLTNSYLNQYNQICVDLKQKRSEVELMLIEYNKIQIDLVQFSRIGKNSNTELNTNLSFSDTLTKSIKLYNTIVDLQNKISVIDSHSLDVLNHYSTIMSIIYDIENLKELKK